MGQLLNMQDQKEWALIWDNSFGTLAVRKINICKAYKGMGTWELWAPWLMDDVPRKLCIWRAYMENVLLIDKPNAKQSV